MSSSIPTPATPLKIPTTPADIAPMTLRTPGNERLPSWLPPSSHKETEFGNQSPALSTLTLDAWLRTAAGATKFHLPDGTTLVTIQRSTGGLRWLLSR